MPTNNLAAAIDAAIVRQADTSFRSHLGASVVGHACARKIWYDFRWLKEPDYSARTLRIFDRGLREESVLIEYLRSAGVTVISRTPDGNQLRVTALAGHFGGSLDSIASNVPGQPQDDWILLEFKTHNATSFRELLSKRVEQAKPEHFIQMQMYLGLGKLTRAMYLAVNKDTDEMYIEDVDFNESVFRKYLERAEAIIRSNEPPPRINIDPAWFLCRLCEYRTLCHSTTVLPHRNCRTCTHSTPSMTGSKGEWVCEISEVPPYPVIPIEVQHTGCGHYVVNPTI